MAGITHAATNATANTKINNLSQMNLPDISPPFHWNNPQGAPSLTAAYGNLKSGHKRIRPF
jgi:hypothetical protein